MCPLQECAGYSKGGDSTVLLERKLRRWVSSRFRPAFRLHVEPRMPVLDIVRELLDVLVKWCVCGSAKGREVLPSTVGAVSLCRF